VCVWLVARRLSRASAPRPVLWAISGPHYHRWCTCEAVRYRLLGEYILHSCQGSQAMLWLLLLLLLFTCFMFDPCGVSIEQLGFCLWCPCALVLLCRGAARPHRGASQSDCASLLAALELPPQGYQVGLTKVFLKKGAWSPSHPPHAHTPHTPHISHCYPFTPFPLFPLPVPSLLPAPSFLGIRIPLRTRSG
jgi:hypothetical protein